uniref:Uncharacterized protein n=1 Tax=Nicotiana tabacum TaxID=4097 RepID=A0A1S4BWK3_TOBAC|nr:PREDICTED: uncharacterized protein LOC107812602 [Nicotiana tabacum]
MGRFEIAGRPNCHEGLLSKTSLKVPPALAGETESRRNFFFGQHVRVRGVEGVVPESFLRVGHWRLIYLVVVLAFAQYRRIKNFRLIDFSSRNHWKGRAGKRVFRFEILPYSAGYAVRRDFSIVDFTHVHVRVLHSEGDLTVKMKLHSLKIKDELQRSLCSGPQYLACSVLVDHGAASCPDPLEPHGKELPLMVIEEDDIFKDALPDFLSFTDSAEATTPEKELLRGRSVPGDIFYEALGSDDSDFVSLTFITRTPDSPDYDGIDTQMSVRMSKLEFFCNRPTLVALIDFGFDLSSGNNMLNNKDLPKDPDESSVNKEKTEEQGHTHVKGLLGRGKDRVVFFLNMNVDSVTVFLNKEDGSQLAMFVQESFLLDIKVHPSSTSIEGTLGNFRLCDLTLGSDQRWGWLCDIRNQGAESLIQFVFKSHSTEDDDYEGYDYSLRGRLSAVRIVFLYRFVQEITAYFMELATPHTEDAIKLVDKVGGIEWLIQKYEVDGASAIKLDLSLDTPLIIVPRNSRSEESVINLLSLFIRTLACLHYAFVNLEFCLSWKLGHLKLNVIFQLFSCSNGCLSALCNFS